MVNFMDIVRQAQQKELEDVEKNHVEERKQAEALRKVNYPGTISGRELIPRVDEEEKLTKQLDEIEEASRKAEKDEKNAERPLEGAFPPPPIKEPA